MLPADGSRWFGKIPPDLSLITRSRGEDQVYNFLRMFYEDPNSPTGTDTTPRGKGYMVALEKKRMAGKEGKQRRKI